MNAKRISQDSKEAFRNPWVLGLIGAIVLVFGVNAAFITTAFMTSPGLVDKDYYEKGRDMEQHFSEKIAMEHRLGWTFSMAFPEEIILNTDGMFNLNLTDKAGLPVRGAKVTFMAYRPSDASADFQQEMVEIAHGIYQAKAAFPLKGIWEVTTVVELGQDKLERTRRIIVRTPS